jgi:nucleotide-binding universal stress UspA family protein
MQLVVAMDYSDCSRQACTWAATHGPKLGAKEATFIYVCDQLSLHALEAEGAKLRAVVDDIWKDVKDVVRRYSVVHGAPDAEIIKAAVEHEAFAIVMGTNGRTGFDRLFLGSVAEKVVRGAPCTVITVKPRPEAP